MDDVDESVGADVGMVVDDKDSSGPADTSVEPCVVLTATAAFFFAF